MKKLIKKILKLLPKGKMDKPFRYMGLEKDYEKYLKKGKKLLLCVNIGRSGTRWLTDIVSMHENATGSVERYSVLESFYRYTKWNELPIDI